MTVEEAKKFLKSVITYPQKPDGESKYPYYWRSKFNEVLQLLEQQSEALKEAEKGILDAQIAVNEEADRTIAAYQRFEVPLDPYEYRSHIQGKAEGLDIALVIIKKAKEKLE